MTKLEFKNHPVWQDLTEVLENLDANAVVTEHLELCNYKISGYYDERDEYYEEITLPRFLSAELVSSSIGLTGKKRWVRLKFLLKADCFSVEDTPIQKDTQKIGELILIHNENLEFVDENWHIDINFLSAIANR